MEHNYIVRMLTLLIIAMSGVGAWWGAEGAGGPLMQMASIPSHREALLTVAFLDVGQGDAIYIETPDGVEALIDGGPDTSVLRGLGQEMSMFDRSLDVVMATHEDADHIGGLVEVMKRFDIGTVLLTRNKSDTPLAEAWREAVVESGVSLIHPTPGTVIALGDEVTLIFFSPPLAHEALETNTASLVAKLTYGEVDFLLTGDAPSGIETYLTRQYGARLASEVLKLGHHGSDTSSAADFLSAVAPTYAVVSAGKNNRYGHPHEEVVARVATVGATLVSTAEEGTIRFRSDGRKVWVE